MPDEKKYGTPTPEQLAKINRLTKRQFKAEEVFVFDAKFIGDGLITDRFMKLDKALIEGFVKDAQNGDVAYMLNHAWATWGPMRGLPNFGRVFESWSKESNDLPDETVAQYGSIFVVRSDAEKQGTTANQLIADIEAGILFDVSIGFGYRKAECSICGNDIRDWRKCEHYPGKEYDGKLCYIIAKPPGDEFEISSVFAGAYPTASALSALGVSEDEAKTENYVSLEVEDIKRVDPGAKILTAYGKREATIWVPKDAIREKASFSVAPTLDKEGGEKLSTEHVIPAHTHEITAHSHDHSHSLNDDPVTVTASVEQDAPVAPQEAVGTEIAPAETNALSIDKNAVVEALGKEMDADAILRLAKEGQALKADLLEDVLTWGVRADGNAFARDTFAEMLASASVEQLKTFRESFKARAKEALKPGRETVPMEKKSTKTDTVPNDAYKV